MAQPAQYAAPGFVSDLDGRHKLISAWNQTIAQAWSDGAEDFLDPSGSLANVSALPIAGMPTPILWSPVPRQVVACLGRSRAIRLCDAEHLPGAPTDSLRSGREWHNEYCEYRVIMANDRGRRRPKRVELTTELREYWETLAVEDPEQALHVAQEVLADRTVSPMDLYGVPNPVRLSREQRRDEFVRRSAGSALRSNRTVPSGPLNRERALFMCHPINGLDDLAYILTLGAQPYFRIIRGARAAAPLPWLFLDTSLLRHSPEAMAALRDTYCRHSDPAAVAASYQVAFGGGRIALADPPGVYMRPEDFDLAALRYQDQPLDPSWVQWSRPAQGPRHQRLVIGPPDDAEDVFLDDIQVCRGGGAEPTKLEGGYQILELLSVGPEVTLQLDANSGSIRQHEADLQLQPLLESIHCGASGSAVCRDLQAWAALLEDPPSGSAAHLNYQRRSITDTTAALTSPAIARHR